MKKFKFISLILSLLTLAGLAVGCVAPVQPVPSEPVTLTIAGSWDDCKAIEAVGRKFTTEYPNCTIIYEGLQDYYTSVEKRMSGEDAIDIFFTTNIQNDSSLLPYALDIKSSEAIDLSNTFDGLIENFAYLENGARSEKLYSIPLGAELRGLYVNKTLLKSLDLEVPTDSASLLTACAKLKENGYIPFHGNPGDFSQTLIYPWICNTIANADNAKVAYDKVNAREEGLSQMFIEPFSFLYSLIENDYYNYKKAQTELNLFNDTTTLDYARYFFNIQADGDSWKKVDDIGQVAFMPSPMSIKSTMDKTKDDYHSEIEYVFVLSPIGTDGGYAYMSPAHGIAVNKGSMNLEWSEKFIDYLYQPENNKLFAEEFNIVPNTKEAFDYISKLFDVPTNRISQLGQVTFDYGFYQIVHDVLLDISKGNNPKYMLTNADGSTSLYPLEHYLNSFEESMKGNE